MNIYRPTPAYYAPGNWTIHWQARTPRPSTKRRVGAFVVPCWRKKPYLARISRTMTRVKSSIRGTQIFRDGYIEVTRLSDGAIRIFCAHHVRLASPEEIEAKRVFSEEE